MHTFSNINALILRLMTIAIFLALLVTVAACSTPGKHQFSVHHYPFSEDVWNKAKSVCEDTGFQHFDELQNAQNAEDERRAVDRFFDAEGVDLVDGKHVIKMKMRLAFVNDEGRPYKVTEELATELGASEATGIRGVFRISAYIDDELAVTMYYTHDFIDVSNAFKRLGMS